MKEKVKQVLLNIKNRFEENHHIFLGEEDIRCHIFSDLLQHFNNTECTRDGKYTIPLHAQISFKSPNNDLRTGEKPDILLIDIPSMDLYTDGKVKPQLKLRKGFQFRKAPIGIEIKINWRRSGGGIKNQISKEIDKIKRIQERNEEMFFYLLYFDKRARLSDEEIKTINQELENIEVIYYKGND